MTSSEPAATGQTAEASAPPMTDTSARDAAERAVAIVAEAINKARYDVPNGIPYLTLEESGPRDRDYCDRLARAAIAAHPAVAVPDDVRRLAVQLIDEIDGLVSESEGVAGLHLNGDVAPWEELLSEGQYERLTSLNELRDVIAAQQTPVPAAASGVGLREALERARADMAMVSALLTSDRHLQDPKAPAWWDAEIAALDAAIASAPEQPTATSSTQPVPAPGADALREALIQARSDFQLIVASSTHREAWNLAKGSRDRAHAALAASHEAAVPALPQKLEGE